VTASPDQSLTIDADVLTEALLRMPFSSAVDEPELDEHGSVYINTGGTARFGVSGISFSILDTQSEAAAQFQDWQTGLADWLNVRVEIGNAALGPDAVLLHLVDSDFTAAVCGTTIENVVITASAVGNPEVSQDRINVVAYGLCEEAVDHLRNVQNSLR
jgi:hypothetical protein